MGLHTKRGFLVITIVFLTLLIFAIGYPLTLDYISGNYSRYDPIENVSQNPSITATQVWTKVGSEEGWLQEFITAGAIGGGSGVTLPTCLDGEVLAYHSLSSTWQCFTLPTGLNLPACTSNQYVKIDGNALSCGDFTTPQVCANGQVLVYNSVSSSWQCTTLASGITLPACTTSQVLYINATGGLDCKDFTGGGSDFCSDNFNESSMVDFSFYRQISTPTPEYTWYGDLTNLDTIVLDERVPECAKFIVVHYVVNVRSPSTGASSARLSMFYGTSDGLTIYDSVPMSIVGATSASALSSGSYYDADAGTALVPIITVGGQRVIKFHSSASNLSDIGVTSIGYVGGSSSGSTTLPTCSEGQTLVANSDGDLVCGTLSGVGSGSASIGDWPNAIRCVSGNDWELYYLSQNSSQKMLYVRESSGWVRFNADKTYDASSGTNAGCNGKSISTLISEGNAYFFGGLSFSSSATSSNGSGIDSELPDGIICGNGLEYQPLYLKWRTSNEVAYGGVGHDADTWVSFNYPALTLKTYNNRINMVNGNTTAADICLTQSLTQLIAQGKTFELGGSSSSSSGSATLPTCSVGQTLVANATGDLVCGSVSGSSSGVVAYTLCTNAQSQNSSNAACYGAAQNQGAGTSQYRVMSCTINDGARNYTHTGFITRNNPSYLNQWSGSGNGDSFACIDGTILVANLEATVGSSSSTELETTLVRTTGLYSAQNAPYASCPSGWQLAGCSGRPTVNNNYYDFSFYALNDTTCGAYSWNGGYAGSVALETTAHCARGGSGSSGNATLPTCSVGQTLVANATGDLVCASLPSSSLTECPAGQTLLANATGQMVCDEVPLITPPSCNAGQVVIINALGQFDCGNGGNIGESIQPESAVGLFNTSFVITNTALGTDGSLYVAGYSGLGVLNFGNGVTYTRSGSNFTNFLVKYDSIGLAQWFKAVNSTSSVLGSSDLEVDISGNVIWVSHGSMSSSPWLLNFGNAVTTTPPGSPYTFVAKISSAGVSQFARAFPYLLLKDVTVDNLGNIYFVGNSGTSGGFVYEFGNGVTYNKNNLNMMTGDLIGSNLIYGQFNSTGAAQWVSGSLSKCWDSFSDTKITTDSNKLILHLTSYCNIAGRVRFLPNFELEPPTGYNNFVVYLNMAGQTTSGAQTTHQFSPNINAIDSAIDSAGNVITLENTGSSISLSKYSSVEPTQIWIKTLPGNIDLSDIRLTISDDDSIFILGQTSANSLDFGNNVIFLKRNLGESFFLVEYDSNGVAKWVANAGGDGKILSDGVHVDSYKSVYVFGSSDSTSLDFGNGVTYAKPISSKSQYFMAKYTLQPNAQALTGTENVLVYDETGNLKQTTTQSIANLASNGVILRLLLDSTTIADHRVLRDVNGMNFVYEPNSVYTIDLYLLTNRSSTNNGYGFVIGTSTSVSNVGINFVHQLANNTGTLSGGSFNGNQNIIGISSGTPSSTSEYIQGSGILVTGSQGGVATLRQRSASNNPTTLKKDSVIVVKKVG
jgi:hypothetical protein